MKKVRVRVPATSANLGPGFDCLGVALKLYNEVELTLNPPQSPFGKGGGKRDFIEIMGEGTETLPRGERNIVYQSVKFVFNELRITNYELRMKLVNRIPLARGLGSSAAARIGGLVAANMISGNKLSEQEILNIATEMEGHPDNVVPALKGGLCVSFIENGKAGYLKLVPPKGLSAVVCVPEFELSTEKARKILPKTVSLSDAVFNSSRVALLLASLIKNNYNYLDIAMADKLHQPYRTKLVSGLNEVLSSAKKAGALGVALSGSGPTVLALAEKNKNENIIGRAMQKTFTKYRITSKYLVVDFDITGVKII